MEVNKDINKHAKIFGLKPEKSVEFKVTFGLQRQVERNQLPGAQGVRRATGPELCAGMTSVIKLRSLWIRSPA